MSGDTYKIESYTDTQCFEMLGLNNPTDRELEMTILKFMDQYEEKSKRLYQFFESMYDRFFSHDDEEDDDDDDDDDDEIEGFDAPDLKIDPTTNALYSTDDETFAQEKNSEEYRVANTQASTLTKAPVQILTQRGNTVTQVQQVDYVKDQYKLNPVERKTIFKMISIDSQFREDPTSTSATNFTMNLSEPIDNVISMKLYSVQIPYTWYTINDTFGSNFFYLKGNSPGIDNGDHDIKVDIRSGTYTSASFVSEINDRINSLKSVNTDVSFGQTAISYDTTNSKTTFTVDLNKKFNETDYQLYFPTWSTPNVVGANKSKTIPSFLGFNYQYYYPYVAYSSMKILTFIGDPNEPTNITEFAVDQLNNYFTIYQYTDNASAFNIATSTIVNSIPIALTLQTGRSYSRNDLETNINASLNSNEFVDTQFSRFQRVNTIDTSFSHYEIAVKLNREKIFQTDGSKLAIVFPNENAVSGKHIWTGNASCFVFADNNTYNTYELNEIVSETETLLTNYIIDNSSAKMVIECVKPNYDVIENTRIATVAGSPLTGYLWNEYIAAVNDAINTMNNATKNPLIQPNGEFNTITQLSTSTDYAEFTIDILRFFTQETYIFDLSSCFLSKTPFNFDVSINNLTNTSFTITEPFSSAPQIDISPANNNNFLRLIPKTTGGPNGNGYGNQNAGNIDIVFTTKTYTTLAELINGINQDFINFSDSDNYKIAKQCSIQQVPQTNTMTFNIQISKDLTELDYKVTFIDNSQNSWNIYLHMDSSYNLLDFRDVASSTSILTGNIPVYDNIITLTSLNNKIVFKPYTNGVANVDGYNDIVLELPLESDNTKTYTREALILQINSLLQENPLTVGSSISLVNVGNLQYTKIRSNINKTFSAKDYKLVFYDPESFVYCNVGVAQNVTWDSTLGWILGFQSFTEYELGFTQNYTDTGNAPTTINGGISIRGDAVLNTNLYNYFMVVLDDFIQNHVNSGIITIASLERDVSLPSYANKAIYYCDPVTGEKTATSALNQNLTANQLYAMNQIMEDKRRKVKSYATGPYLKDVFAIIPLKLAGLTLGQTYMEFGGTLQNQDRKYFGPVRIQKLAVKLMTDKGSTVLLNRANWSFSVICEIMTSPAQ
jgi:hypothetical protein